MPAQTGLSQLGDALLRGSGDYANIQLRRQQEERNRANQLEDLADARRYSEGQTTAGVSRQKELFTWQQQQARIRELIALGFLAEADAADEMKVAAADAEATKRTAGMRTESDAADKEAKAYVNDIARQLKDLDTETRDVQAKLAAIPDAPVPPTTAAVDSLAKRLAARDKADYKNDAVRVQFQEAARAELERKAQMDLYFLQQKAETYRQILSGSRLRFDALNSQLTDFARRKILPTIKPPPTAAPTASLAPPQAPGLREASAEDKAVAAGVPAPTASGTGAPPPALPNPLNNPALATFQAQQAQQAPIDARQARTNELAKLLAVRDEARTRGASATASLQSSTFAPPNDPIVGMRRENYAPPRAPTPPSTLAGEISTAGQDEVNAMNAYRKLLMQLGPLPQLPKIKTPPPASVFALPDPYGAPIF